MQSRMMMMRRAVPDVITSGLASRWTFEEGTGTTTADVSGNGNTATLINSPGWVTGLRGSAYALDFNGSTTHCTLANSNLLNGASGCAILLRCHLDSVALSPATFLANWYSATTKQVLFRLLNSDLTGYISTSGTNQTGGIFFSGIATGVEYALGLDWDGTTLRCYKNGVVSGATFSGVSGAVSSPSGTMYIARYYDATHINPVDGRMDDVRLYARSLSAGEHAAYAAGAG